MYLAGSLVPNGAAIQPREAATGVNMQEVGLSRLSDAHGNEEVAEVTQAEMACVKCLPY